MKEGWIVKSLGEVGKVSMCKRVLKKQTNSVSGIPFYKIGTFGKEPNAYIDESLYNEFKEKYSYPKVGDILLSASGTIGRRVVYDGKPAYFQDSNIVWIDNDESEVLNEYLYKFYGHCKWNASKGATISRLYNDDLRRIQIPIPLLEEQKQIVAILDDAFAAIDQAQANIEKNIENAKELFQSKLNDIFSQKGDGWEEKSLGDESLIKIIDGDRGKNYPRKSDFLESGHCIFLNTGNVRPDGFDLSTLMFISEERDNLLRKGKLQRNDVVMTTRGTIGNLGWYSSDIDYEHIRINSGMLIFRVNQEKLLPEYLFTLLRSPLMKKQIIDKTTGAAQPQLPIKILVKFKIPVNSSLLAQKNMIDLINHVEMLNRSLITNFETKLTNLEDLKKSLLEKAFAGELTSKDMTA